MSVEHSHLDVSGGFYTVSEAARLLRMSKVDSILRWLSPTPKGAPPVVQRSFPKIGLQHELSFLDMLEIRFVEHFRKEKISLQSLRIAAANAREELRVPHPFATGSVKFQTDRKKIFLETAKETGDLQLLDLMTKQLAIYEFIEDSLARDLEFDVSGLARLWRPAPNVAPDVVISPVFAFGQPVISSRHVPTATLVAAWRANDGDIEAVADWHAVSTEDVRQAVEFETRTIN